MNDVRVENLYRQEAIRALARKEPGRPICLMPRPWVWLTAVVVLLFTGLSVLLVGGEYLRSERVRGWLVSSTGIIRVTSAGAATITNVARSPGERVQKGDVLFTLSAESTLLGGAEKNALQLAQLHDERSEVEYQIGLSRRQQYLNNSSLGQQLLDLEQQMSALHAESDEQLHRIDLGADRLRRLQHAAENGAVARVELIRHEEDLSTLKQGLSRLQQSIAAIQRELTRISGEKDSLPTHGDIQRSQLRARHKQLSQLIVEREAARQTLLTAMADSVVATVEVGRGATITPGELLMTLLPMQGTLRAEVYVPSRAVGFIEEGQSVEISYDSYPRQSFGVFSGTVEHISDSVLRPSEIPQNFHLQEASYKVRIRIDANDILVASGGAALRPGMQLVARIVLERRSLLDWLLEPLQFRPASAS